VGQSWWNCEEDMWGRVGGIVKRMCGESWWNCEEDVWGRVGGIVKLMYAICFEFRRIKYLSVTSVYFCTYSGTSWLVYEATITVLNFRSLWSKSQGCFQMAKIINSDWIGEVFSYNIPYNVNCVRRYSATDMWFGLYLKQRNTKHELGQIRQSVSAIIRPLLRTLYNSHLTLPCRLLSNVQHVITDLLDGAKSFL
jgi:hypothetical protein